MLKGSHTPTVYKGSHMVRDETVPSLADSLLKLGGGAHRQSYLLDDVVLKVAGSDSDWGMNPMSDCRKANLRERDRWEWMKDGPMARGFAAILAASPDGSWIVQELVAGVLENDLDYDMVEAHYCHWHREVYGPVYRRYRLNDVHPGNLGLTEDGRIVAFDYAGYWHK